MNRHSDLTGYGQRPRGFTALHMALARMGYPGGAGLGVPMAALGPTATMGPSFYMSPPPAAAAMNAYLMGQALGAAQGWQGEQG